MSNALPPSSEENNDHPTDKDNHKSLAAGDAITLIRPTGINNSGNEQDAYTGALFALRLTVNAFDAAGSPASSGTVTFTVSPSQGSIRGMINVTADNTQNFTRMDVPVQNGRASVLLWGINTSAIKAKGILDITAEIKGNTAQHTSFKAYVWPEELKLSKVSGDNQSLNINQPLKEAPVVKLLFIAAPASYVWLKMTVTGGIFRKPTQALVDEVDIIWVDDHTLWSRTDATGQAQAPFLVAGGTPGKMVLTVSANNATSQAPVIFTFTIDNAVPPVPDWSLSLVDDNDRLVNVQEESTLRIKVLYKGAPVPDGTTVTAQVDTAHNGANISLATATASTSSSVAVFYVTAMATGISTITFHCGDATLTVQIQASANTHGRLEVYPQVVSVFENEQKLFDPPILIRFSPANIATATINYTIVPAEGDGLHVIDDNGIARLEGSLPVNTGNAHISLLKGGNKSGSYQIIFTAPGTTMRAVLNVTVTPSQLYGRIYHNNQSPYAIDAGSEINDPKNLFAVTYEDSTLLHTIPHVPLEFIINATDAQKVTFVDGGTSVSRSSDADGLVPIPPFIVSDGFRGHFDIIMECKGQQLDTVRFEVNQALPASEVEFHPSSPLDALRAYGTGGLGDVLVYTIKPNIAHSGRMIFEITNSTGSAGVGSGFIVQNQAVPARSTTATIDTQGGVSIPAFKTGGTGTITITATVEGTTISTSATFRVQ